VVARHPRGTRLGAWFDGEGEDLVGAHVVRCSRCQKRVSELSRVRAWVRAQPFFAMGEETARLGPAPRRTRPLLVPALLVLLFFLLVPTTPWVSRQAPVDSSRMEEGHSASPPIASVDPEGPASTPADESGEADVGATAAGEQASAEAGASRRSASPLRLGLVVPATGPLAAEGAEIVDVVRRRITLANAGGGVGGLPVELVVVRAEDGAGVAGLRRRGVAALIGGFGIAPPPGLPWLLPADPSVTGSDVLPVEAPAWSVGAQLGSVLRGQGLHGPIGVVRGSGPDAGLAEGLATQARTTVVPLGADGSCHAEVASLRRSGAVALAIAGEPDLAGRCLDAARRIRWRPRFGTLVAPSAAYTVLPSSDAQEGPRTVLALPWPTWDVPGAARFRASTQSSSYRALVSFAAAELAIDVARQAGGISLPAMAFGSWRSDLLDVVGNTTETGAVVVAGVGTWLQTSPLPVPGVADVPLSPPVAPPLLVP
jgi:ABC-type branched-subunit amino acid transport system substrate-binding protein